MVETLASPPHVAAYRFAGELTDGDYDVGIADFEVRPACVARIAVAGDISSLHGAAGEVIGRDLIARCRSAGLWRSTDCRQGNS